jgi:hypothetical protein
MNKVLGSTVAKFGVFAIIAVLNTGCAVSPYRMEAESLDHFVVECSRKAEQLAFIESQRTNKGQRVNAGVANYLFFWRAATDPAGYQRNQDIHSGYQDWLLNQILFEISRCP